ncbi:uncharacterized protein LOC116179038 [Photinus pyralis]|nr:uncharacterized protein LOC116179038 [Photinus pyralis]
MDFSVHVALILPLVFCSVDALKCYVCKAYNETYCQIGNPHLRIVDCGLEDTTFFWFCLYKVFEHTNSSVELHSYSCERMGRLDTKILQEKYSFGCERRASPAIFPSAAKLPHCRPEDGQTLKTCRVCFTDLCAFADYSGSVTVTTNLIFVLAAIIVDSIR